MAEEKEGCTAAWVKGSSSHWGCMREQGASHSLHSSKLHLAVNPSLSDLQGLEYTGLKLQMVSDSLRARLRFFFLIKGLEILLFEVKLNC